MAKPSAAALPDDEQEKKKAALSQSEDEESLLRQSFSDNQADGGAAGGERADGQQRQRHDADMEAPAGVVCSICTLSVAIIEALQFLVRRRRVPFTLCKMES